MKYSRRMLKRLGGNLQRKRKVRGAPCKIVLSIVSHRFDFIEVDRSLLHANLYR